MTAPTYPDIAAFLTAQLDRLEGLAKAHGATALGNRWAIGLGTRGLPSDGPSFVAVEANGGVAVAELDYSLGGHEAASHIAQHDPAFVLADIAAKRAVVAEYRKYSETNRVHAPVGAAEVYVLGKALRHLAAPFADQPGYRPEWAVG